MVELHGNTPSIPTPHTISAQLFWARILWQALFQPFLDLFTGKYKYFNCQQSCSRQKNLFLLPRTSDLSYKFVETKMGMCHPHLFSNLYKKFRTVLDQYPSFIFRISSLIIVSARSGTTSHAIFSIISLDTLERMSASCSSLRLIVPVPAVSETPAALISC